MNWQLLLWVVTLVSAIVGIAAKDWRTNALCLGCALLALILMLFGHGR